MSRSPGKIVVARDARLRDGEGTIRAARLADLLRRALCRLGGVKDPKALWASLFSPTETVGLKINCLAGRRLSTTVSLVEAVAQSLKRAGVAPERIVVWDRSGRELRAAGFKVRRSGGEWRCYGTDQVGYEREISFSGEVGSCLSRILTRRITVLINVGVLKDHDLAGVSIGMKNLYGVIHNPNRYHDNVCDPYVADVSNLARVRRILRLTIADGTLAQCHNGPAYNPAYAWNYNGILIGADPVALDRVGCEILEKRRAAQGLPSLQKAKRWPAWLKTAEKYGLGVAELGKIQVLEEGDGL